VFLSIQVSKILSSDNHCLNSTGKLVGVSFCIYQITSPILSHLSKLTGISFQSKVGVDSQDKSLIFFVFINLSHQEAFLYAILNIKLNISE
jgi:hypothetical protein